MTAAQYLVEMGVKPAFSGHVAPVVSAGSPFSSRLGEVKKPRKTEEEDLHRHCADWLRHMEMRHPQLLWTHHSPNGGLRTRAEAGRLKAMGVKKGYPDLVNHKALGGWRGFAIELKAKKGVVSEDQADWLDSFENDGYLTGIARNLDQFMEMVNVYLGLVPNSALIGSRS